MSQGLECGDNLAGGTASGVEPHSTLVGVVLEAGMGLNLAGLSVS